MYIHTCFCRHIYTNVHACKIYLYMQAVVNGYMYNGRGALSPNERCLQATVSSSNSAAENGMDYFSSPAHLNQSAITNRTARISGGQPSWKDEWLSVLSISTNTIHQSRGTLAPRVVHEHIHHRMFCLLWTTLWWLVSEDGDVIWILQQAAWADDILSWSS